MSEPFELVMQSGTWPELPNSTTRPFERYFSAPTVVVPSHQVYRFFNQADRLLYVGCTSAFKTRWRQHRTDQPWWHEVVRCTVTGPLPADEAYEMEHAAILAESPLYNRSTHRQPPRYERPAGMQSVVGCKEIENLLGISRQRVNQLAAKPTFPAPLALLAVGRIWATDDILEWAKGTGRL